MKNGPAELNSLKRESGRSGWLSVAGDEISCGGEKVRRRDWEKGVKSEEKRRVFFWVVRWASCINESGGVFRLDRGW